MRQSFSWTQGRIQDFFQGVAEISSRGGKNLPGGGEKIVRYPLPLSVYLRSYITLLIYAHWFNIFDTCRQEI